MCSLHPWWRSGIGNQLLTVRFYNAKMFSLYAVRFFYLFCVKYGQRQGSLFIPTPFCYSIFSLILGGKAQGCCPDAQGVVWLCLSPCWWLLIPSNRPAWARHGWGLRQSRNYTRPSIIAAMQAITVAASFLHAKEPKWGTQWQRMRQPQCSAGPIAMPRIQLQEINRIKNVIFSFVGIN